MWGNNLSAPPITVDLWVAIRDRLRVRVIDAILGGTNRVYVEGEQSASGEDVESKAWGRIVIIPADPIVEPRFEEGLPTILDFLLRMDVNSRARAGYSHSFHLQRGLREAFRLIQGWFGPITSSEVMIAGEIRGVTSWRPQPLDDSERSGTLFMSQRYQVDVCEAQSAA